MQTHLLTTILDLLGVFANGLLGGAVARSQNMDLFGFAAMGLVSGLGGGIIRDVLLEHGTPAALVDGAYIPTALAGAAIAFLMHIQSRAWSRVFVLVDGAAISLGATGGAARPDHGARRRRQQGPDAAAGPGRVQGRPALRDGRDRGCRHPGRVRRGVRPALFYGHDRCHRGGVRAQAGRLLARLAAADRPRLGTEQDPAARRQAAGTR